MTTQTRVAQLLLTVTLTTASTFGLHASSTRDAQGQVRPADRRVAALVQRGAFRSRIIDGLLARIARSDVIVYIRSHGRSPAQLAGGTQFMGRSPDGRRWLMVTIYDDEGWTRLEDAETQHLVTLGHELHHVLEVIEHPEIVDRASFEAFYLTNGDVWADKRVETAAARVGGSRVANELRSGD